MTKRPPRTSFSSWPALLRIVAARRAARAASAEVSVYSTTCGRPGFGVTVLRNVARPALRTSRTCGAAGSVSVWLAAPRDAPSTNSSASAGSPRTDTSPSTASRVSDSVARSRDATVTVRVAGA